MLVKVIGNCTSAEQGVSYIQKLFVSCEKINMEFRDATHNRFVWNVDANVRVWHWDGVSSTRPPPEYLIMWSNREVTELKEKDSNGFPGPALPPFPHGSVLLFNNRLILHRMPARISEERVFARVWDVQLADLKKELLL